MGNVGPVALFSISKLTTSSERHLEDISHAHNVPLLWKLLTSAKDTNGLLMDSLEIVEGGNIG